MLVLIDLLMMRIHSLPCFSKACTCTYIFKSPHPVRSVFINVVKDSIPYLDQGGLKLIRDCFYYCLDDYDVSDAAAAE